MTSLEYKYHGQDWRFSKGFKEMKRATSLQFGMLVVLAIIGYVGCNSAGNSTTGADGKSGAKAPIALVNVSYDPTRELWRDINKEFIPAYEKETGQPVTIEQVHGGSASQARLIIDGMKADVATLSIWTDTDSLRKEGLLKEGWENALPNKSLPYTSTVVFVVRKGNPKGIHDWTDLVKSGVEIITPNPKTSGNGRLSLLGAWGSVVLNGGSEADATQFLQKLYGNVKILDTGARGATLTFATKGQGDVHLAMESEAYREIEDAKGELEMVTPAQSILHEPQVAVVDSVVDQRGTRAAAEAYLKFVYTPVAQEIIAKHHYRPTDPSIAAKTADQFAKIKLFPITDIVPDWEAAQAKFFADGAIFDNIYLKK